jgi:hypothetical protein
MPTVRTPDEATLVLKAPLCSECGNAVRLERSEPSILYSNVDQLKYVCNCGQTTEKLVGRY